MPTESQIRKPRPGEVQMKEFLMAEADRRGVTPTTVWVDLKRGRYPDVEVRRVTTRLVFVSKK